MKPRGNKPEDKKSESRSINQIVKTARSKKKKGMKKKEQEVAKLERKIAGVLEGTECNGKRMENEGKKKKTRKRTNDETKNKKEKKN